MKSETSNIGVMLAARRWMAAAEAAVASMESWETSMVVLLVGGLVCSCGMKRGLSVFR